MSQPTFRSIEEETTGAAVRNPAIEDGPIETTVAIALLVLLLVALLLHEFGLPQFVQKLLAIL